jgi:hypothetical protein
MRLLIVALISILLIGCSESSTENRSIESTNSDGTLSINKNNLQEILDASVYVPLTSQEKKDLLFLREEEKVAHDVYTQLHFVYGLNIFENIANAEQTHTDAVLLLIDYYGLQDPVSNNNLGVFENQTLQNLYNDLVAQGSQTLLDALMVVAAVEEIDIQDIEEMIQRSDNENLLLVYGSLQKGSRNHLRSFVKQIESLGHTYTPQYISQNTYDSIISSDMERY